MIFKRKGEYAQPTIIYVGLGRNVSIIYDKLIYPLTFYELI